MKSRAELYSFSKRLDLGAHRYPNAAILATERHQRHKCPSDGSLTRQEERQKEERAGKQCDVVIT